MKDERFASYTNEYTIMMFSCSTWKIFFYSLAVRPCKPVDKSSTNFNSIYNLQNTFVISGKGNR